MRLLTLAVLAAAVARPQILLEPDKIPRVRERFEPKAGERRCKCYAEPLHTYLNFGFRFQAGFYVRVPLDQYAGKGHVWGIVVRITPEEGNREPTYLGMSIPLPEIPKTKDSGFIGGGYLLGEGNYSVEWLLVDETGRVCRAHWRTKAKLGRGDSHVTMRQPPDTVQPLYRLRPLEPHLSGSSSPQRVTVLLHAAPVTWFGGYRIRNAALQMRLADEMRLLGMLGVLVEDLPDASLRVVAFNLDQQKELYRCDNCSSDVVRQVAQAVEEMKLALVDYRVLANPHGDLDLLTQLVRGELQRNAPSDAVVFLGPTARQDQKPRALPAIDSDSPKFYYFEYSNWSFR